jgi:osmotically-inducible protein OsmY
MPDHLPEKSTLVKFAGLALGILIGGPIGPIVFTPVGLNVPTAATAGSFFGAILGYAVTAALVSMDRRRRDRELQHAADAVKAEAGLPDSITIRVKDGRITLEGQVDGYTQRQNAEQVMSKLPGVKGVTNRIRLRPAAGQVTASPDEIRKQIRDSFVRLAELDGRGIHVVINNSRLVLEGTVHSWAEASEAEEIAWNIPGVAEVENRLEIAA